MKDRRSSQRFPLNAPLTVRWNNDGLTHIASAESQDVSASGVYFYLPQGLKVGLKVEIAMALPNDVTMRCQGRVLRSGADDSGKLGVAASIERSEFLRNDGFDIP